MKFSLPALCSSLALLAEDEWLVLSCPFSGVPGQDPNLRAADKAEAECSAALLVGWCHCAHRNVALKPPEREQTESSVSVLT